ncbi:MAG: hypothetical protein R6V08_12110 [Desulfuromonadales bacterium]
MTRPTLFHSFWRFACLSFLTLVCCGHVYLSVHLHHFHVNNSVAFKVSFHHLAPEVAHTSAHHHHEEHSSHEDENEHKYEKKNDWRVSRSKSSTNLTFDPPDAPLPACSLPFADFDKFKPFFQALSLKKERYLSSSIIRGPPMPA